jgi:1-acyl-sn-glycerol-3-phosphate acyltransferase
MKKIAQLGEMVLFFVFFQIGVFILSALAFIFTPCGKWGSSVYYKLVSFFLKLLLFLSFVRVKVIGKENIPKEGNLIFVGNHPGMLEPMYVMAYLPLRVFPVADEQILHIPFLGRILKALDCITYKTKIVDPGFMVTLLSILREKGPVLLFPPALRRADGKTQPLGNALLRVAHACQAQLVPFIVKQAGEEHLFRGFFVSPGETKIIIGSPLKGADLTDPSFLEKSFKDLMGR